MSLSLKVNSLFILLSPKQNNRLHLKVHPPATEIITFLPLKKRFSRRCRKFKPEQDYAIIFPRGD